MSEPPLPSQRQAQAVTPHSPRFFFVAGESSGDLHGANLIRALQELNPAAECEGLGGPRMAEAGMRLRYDLASEAIMGFVEVLKKLRQIRRLFYATLARLQEWRPDALVLIDYPGFNIRLAKAAHRLGIPIIYYIGPQVWAWKKGRIHTLARYCREVLVILPFEQALYEEAGLPCRFVGHPLLDYIPTVPLTQKYASPMTIGLLPGSREQEIERILPVMLDVAKGIREHHPGARFVAPCVDRAREAQIRAMAHDLEIETAAGETYEVLSAARLCLVASGTATVETMLFQCPMIVLYKVAPATYWLARMLVSIDHIAMVNILAQRRLVPEFIQHHAAREAILPIALQLLEDSPERRAMLEGLAEVKTALGGPGASQRAAQAVLEAAAAYAHNAGTGSVATAALPADERDGRGTT